MGPASQYFDKEPAAPSRPTVVTLALPDLTLHLASDRGVFSTDEVDAGTRYLLLDGPRPPATGHLLDLGCGYGPIAITLARRAPGATIWAVDVNKRALALCAANASAAGVPNVKSVSPEDLPGDVEFAGIWSNPPIRIGKRALHDLLARWLPRLAPDAAATLVVARNLGSDSLARWLTGEGWAVTRLGSRAGYRLLDVRRP